MWPPGLSSVYHDRPGCQGRLERKSQPRRTGSWVKTADPMLFLARCRPGGPRPVHATIGRTRHQPADHLAELSSVMLNTTSRAGPVIQDGITDPGDVKLSCNTGELAGSPASPGCRRRASPGP